MWGIMEPDVVAEISSHPTLGSLACVAWCRVLVPAATLIIYNCTTSSRHLMQSSFLIVRPCEKMNRCITLPPLVTTRNTMIWTGFLVFINMNLSSDWLPKHSEIFKLEQYSIQFLNFWKSEQHHGATFCTDSMQLTCVCSTVNKIWNK